MNAEKLSRIGVVGLGKMGRPIARHLARKGWNVMGLDTSKIAADIAAAEGIATTCSLPQLAASSDMVIILAGFDAEVEAIIFGSDGLLAHSRPDQVVVISSTVSPRTIAHIGSRLEGKRIRLVDAPITRGERAAEEGKLLIMAGGETDAVELCRPVFEAFSNSIHHLGGVGSGQTGKLINNLILWACMSANYEGMKLAQALNLDIETLRTALVQSSANNWSLENQAEKMPVPWAEKDMSIVLKEADFARVSLPLCGVVKEVIKGFKLEHGLATPSNP